MTDENVARVDPTAVGDQLPEVGARLRRARTEQGVALREFARRVRVSPSHVSQIERGIVAPSVSMLYTMVNELGISLDSLFSEASAEKAAGPPRAAANRVYVQRGDDRKAIEVDSGVRWELLSPQTDEAVDFREIVYQVGGGSVPGERLIRHSGREYGLVLQGELRVQIGFEEFVLHTGDSVAFDASTPHRFWNEGDTPARAVWFACPDL